MSLNSKPLIFFSVWGFFYNHSQITGLQDKGEGISLTPHYHFHPLHRHLDISRAITAESSPLHIGSSRTRTGNLWFPSASRYPLTYASKGFLRQKDQIAVSRKDFFLKTEYSVAQQPERRCVP